MDDNQIRHLCAMFRELASDFHFLWLVLMLLLLGATSQLVEITPGERNMAGKKDLRTI